MMLLPFIRDIIAARNAITSGKQASVTISIPINSPSASRLAELAQKLLIPTTTIRNSGLATKTGMVIPESTDAFISALRQEVGDDIMNELESDLRSQIAAEKLTNIAAIDTATSNNPKFVGSLIQDGLSNEKFRSNMNTSRIAELHNISEALKSDKIN